MPKLNDREYRSIMPMVPTDTKRIESDYYVEGYAATYERYLLYEDYDGPVYEQFERTAFDGCDMSDIILQYNHSGKVLARQRNKTLIVDADENGLFVCADLSKSEASRSLYEEIESGLIDRMSWGFIPLEYYWNEETRTLVHTKVKKIYDVSAVDFPANEGTEIHARAFVNGVIEQRTQELRKIVLEKEKLRLKLKLGGF
nr:HK97 family phage prohead protease [uncultured Anaerotignum sp.]